MINTIIFDIGNVLAGFRWEDCLRELGYEEAMIQRIGRATVHNLLWRELDRRDEIGEDLIAQFKAADPEIGEDIYKYIDHSKFAVKEYDYATDLIDRLKAKGYRVYILSNYGGRNYRYAKEHFSFISHVDGSIISYEHGYVKPEPEIYEALIRVYNINPKNAVFLDDMAINVEAAREHGFYGIQFLNLEQALEELRGLKVNI